MGNTAGKKQEQARLQKEQDDKLKEEIRLKEIERLPQQHDPPNNDAEFRVLIAGYLNQMRRNHPLEIVECVAQFYPFHLILNQKALRIASEQNVGEAMAFLAQSYNLNNEDTASNSNEHNPNALQLMAEFLHSKHPYIGKKEVGEFIAKPESKALSQQQHKELLTLYLQRVGFTEMEFVPALRKLLNNSGFALPAEAQGIDRILDRFAAIYVPSNECSLTEESVLVLSFGLLMLNTETHNEMVKKSRAISGGEAMSLQQFKQMMVMDNVLSDTMLESVYNEIQKEPLF